MAPDDDDVAPDDDDVAPDDDDVAPDDDDVAPDDDDAADDDDVTPHDPFAQEGDDPGECEDGADNDLDGLFDCDDESCAGSPLCADTGGCGSSLADPGRPVGAAGLLVVLLLGLVTLLGHRRG